MSIPSRHPEVCATGYALALFHRHRFHLISAKTNGSCWLTYCGEPVETEHMISRPTFEQNPEARVCPRCLRFLREHEQWQRQHTR